MSKYDMQQKAIEMISQLNGSELDKVLSYCDGLISNRPKKRKKRTLPDISLSDPEFMELTPEERRSLYHQIQKKRRK